MKKILSLITIAFCLSFAAKAQSNQNSTQTQTTVNVKTEIAEPVATETLSSESSPSKASCAPAASKSCCSSKNAKESTGSTAKSCCAEGSKKDSHCSGKKAELSPDQENKSDKKRNSQ